VRGGHLPAAATREAESRLCAGRTAPSSLGWTGGLLGVAGSRGILNVAQA